MTSSEVKKEIFNLKKKYKNILLKPQQRPFVGGAIDLGIKLAKKIYCDHGFRFRNQPHELKKMIKISKKNPDSIISADRWISQKGFNNYGIIKFLANFFFKTNKNFLNRKFLILRLLIDSIQRMHLRIIKLKS